MILCNCFGWKLTLLCTHMEATSEGAVQYSKDELLGGSTTMRNETINHCKCITIITRQL